MTNAETARDKLRVREGERQRERDRHFLIEKKGARAYTRVPKCCISRKKY